MIRILALLAFGVVCFAAGVAYDAYVQKKAREAEIRAFLHSHVFQSPYPLPARILRP